MGFDDVTIELVKGMVNLQMSQGVEKLAMYMYMYIPYLCLVQGKWTTVGNLGHTRLCLEDPKDYTFRI